MIRNRSLPGLVAKVVAVLLLSSCGTSYYYSEFIHPSKIYVPADVYRLGVVNRAVNAQSAAIISVNGVPAEEIKGVPLAAVAKTMDELLKNNEEIGRYDMLRFSLPQRFSTGRGFMRDALSAQQVDSICRALQLDGFASIEGAEVNIKTRGTVDVVTAIDESGFPMRVPEFSNESTITFTVAWRLYDNRYGVLADTYQESYNRIFTAVAFSEQEALQRGLEDLSMKQVAYLAGADYYTRIAPHWKEDFRVYYQTGSEAFYLVSKNLEIDGNWELAASRWKEFTDHADDKIAYRAHFNLAVASEMLGNPREARDWLNKAAAIKKTKNLKRYMAILDRQILVYDVVNRQLGITSE